MDITNKAFLTYNNNIVSSNPVSGELLPALSLQKEALADFYTPDGQTSYALTVVNHSETSFSGLTLLDNLGKYDFQGFPRFPFYYTDNSAVLRLINSSGVSSGAVAETSTADGIVFTFDLPAMTTAFITYTVTASAFAPLAAGSAIINTVTLSGNSSLLPIESTSTLPVEETAKLIISKSICESTAASNTITYNLIVSNYGNTAASSSDYIVISDLFTPPLLNISVEANGVPWTEGTEYEYDENLSFFRTETGVISLDAAEFTQDDFGNWRSTPSSLIIKITGTL